MYMLELLDKLGAFEGAEGGPLFDSEWVCYSVHGRYTG